MRFYLGAPEPSWLRREEFIGVPLFVSERRIGRLKTLPRAVTRWALDSGGFSEIDKYGKWMTTPEHYVGRVQRYVDEVGMLDWASPQDWMCEPQMLEKTGKTVAEHQALTVANLLDLRELAPELPFIPVLQGWEPVDYLRHVELYEWAGVDLTREPLVGVGSVCRRESMPVAEVIFEQLAALGLSLHGFGLKKKGVRTNRRRLRSSDSMAWSYRARMKGEPLPECMGKHKNCNYCPRFALQWRASFITDTEESNGQGK